VSVVTFFVSILIVSMASADGKDGEVGAPGGSGSDGKNGAVSTNTTPRNANLEYAYYMPVLNGDLGSVRKLLKSGLKINWPMGGVVSRPTPFEFMMQTMWIEGIQAMLENSDMSNRADLGIYLQAKNGARVNIYEFLTLGDDLDRRSN
jgi:hypothetical protein